MINNEKVLQVVLESIDELNAQLPKEDKFKKSIDTALFGNGGSIDSLGLISLVTTLEQKIEDNFGISTTLLEDIAALENDNPFRSIKALTNYLTSILEK